MKSPTKLIQNNTVLYKYEDVATYLQVIEPIKDRYVLWYQSLKCVLEIKYSTSNLREESRHSITTLQAPALLLKQIGLLKNITLTDDKNHQLKKSIFKTHDIRNALKEPSIKSINKIFETSFVNLFAESEGWKSKEIAPYLKELYTLIYKNTTKGYVSQKKILDLLSTIKESNQKREKHHKLKLRKENDFKRIERQQLTDGMNEVPPLIEAITKPQTNFESNDTISILGSIISILILLKRFHLQYIERKFQKSQQYIDLKSCKYDKNKAKSCKISLNKLLNSYMAKSMRHTNLGEQFHAILLFNTSITKTQEMIIILWLARIETSFITPLNIIKKFLFYCQDTWLPLPTPSPTTTINTNSFSILNLTNKSSLQDCSQQKFFYWPDINYAKNLKDGKILYTSGIWTSMLMDESYQKRLESLIKPHELINTENIYNRCDMMSDYITLLSVQPNSNLEAMPDIIKFLDKSNNKNILWSPFNRFPTAVAKLEMTRTYQQEINFINTVKKLQNLIDKLFSHFDNLYHDTNIDITICNLTINTKHYELNNSRNLARYITNLNTQKPIKDFINWMNSHQHHIEYYITSIIEQLLPLTQKDTNKDLYHKKAYLIALKLLYKVYQLSKQAAKSNYISKKQLFPSKNSYNQSNSYTKILKQFLFEPIITCVLFNLNPQDYFYLPLKIKLNRYKEFVDSLYKTETALLEDNLIRK